MAARAACVIAGDPSPALPLAANAGDGLPRGCAARNDEDTTTFVIASVSEAIHRLPLRFRQPPAKAFRIAPEQVRGYSQ